MGEPEFRQLLAASLTQNILLAKLVLRMDTGKLPSDDGAFQYATGIYQEILRSGVKIPV